jgi:hypothetical protein
MKKSRMKVIRVTKTEFELEDGRVIPHVVDLDYAPSVEEFQGYLDDWYAKMPLKDKDGDDHD